MAIAPSAFVPIIMDGHTLNANVELDPRGLILHSRSGTERNRDYRAALEAILTRLDAAGIAYELYLDSAPVQSLPLAERRLAAPLTGSVAERFNAIVDAMNAGTSSNGAWRRLLLVTPGATSAMLRSALAQDRSSEAQRLSAAELRRVTHADVDAAVSRLLAGEDVPKFGPSRDYDAIATNGARLAPKKVFALALERALGIRAVPSHFSAGFEFPAYQIVEAAGYPIIAKTEPVSSPEAESVDPEMSAAEGDSKLVTHLRRERRPALAAAKKRAMVAALGRLECQRCHLVPCTSLGPHGDAVIEVHHARVGVSEMGAGHVTRLADLECLCANCHRIVHRELAAAARTDNRTGHCARPPWRT